MIDKYYSFIGLLGDLLLVLCLDSQGRLWIHEAVDASIYHRMVQGYSHIQNVLF